MQQVDTDPPSLPVGTEVSAKYKGAFCEAKVSKVVRNIKVKVAYKQGLGSGIVSDDLIKTAPGQLRVGATVEVRHPDRKDLIEGTVTKIQDCSQYTVVFDDGDITTLRRTALCLKSGRHFNESETLDQLPLTHPEHFGNPVVGGRRGRRRGQLNDDSSDEEDESDTKEVVNEKEEHIGKVVCVEMETKKKDKEKWFPGLVLAPTAQANVRIRVKDEYLVRSFKDGRYYTVPKKEATEFTREVAVKQDGQAVQAALEYLDSGALPPHWDRESLFGLNNSSSEGEGELESDSSDDEPREEKDRFVAQLYKYMDDRGTPLNKVPSIQNRDVDLYRLFRAVQKCGGYNRVTAKNQWKSIAIRLGFTAVTVSVTNLVKQAFKKFLQPYGEFHRKLGCSMLMTPRNSSRSKGRSLVRANSVASPKPVEVNKDIPIKSANIIATTSFSSSASSSSSTQNIIASPVAPLTSVEVVGVATASVTEESENTSESSLDNTKNKRKILIGKVKGLVEKYEEKAKDDCDVPLSKIKAAVESSRSEDKDKVVAVKDNSCTAVSLNFRESSPPATSSANKKDKSQKKQTPQSDDKRNKRKKDDTIEKVDSGDFIVEVGDKLKVYYHEKKVTYEAKVIEISVQRGLPMYLVHYTGWNNRYDEWVPRERIAENITKGSKQKGRMSTLSSAEKQKDNPSKPPTASSLASSGSPNSIINALSSTSSSTKMSGLAKRGRGRSDSLPPRSTTPSSVASNSSRTKSPATAGLKKRPIRTMTNSARRTSANVSDVSLQSESETDSDEPVRRPTRGSKEIEYKSGNLSGKGTIKNKQSVSAGNSQSDTDDEGEECESSTILRAKNSSSNSLNSKGRNYDLSQIRSELTGFPGLKSPSSSLAGDDEILSDIKIEEPPNKDEGIFDAKDICISESKTIAESSARVSTGKNVVKQDLKEENLKSSTDMSSETESFCDDDSQSSGKTTTLENMTKKFQQKIKAGKQQALEKLSCGKPTVERVPRVVEKIIQDSLAEKLQESLKTKPDLRQEENLEKSISETVICKSDTDKKEVNKITSVQTTESPQKGTSTSQVRCSSATNSSKISSVILEKTVSSVKKTEFGSSKKADVIRKGITECLELQSKKNIDPLLKEVNKTEPSAACSPSSSSSSSSSSTSTSSRSLPDMSKLDISGGSSSSSSYTISNKDAKLISVTTKATSPDIYEFKDPEPFELEIRKLPTTNTNASSLSSGAISASSVAASPRKQTQKITMQQVVVSDKQQPSQSPIAVLVNRKKRGSPMKEAPVDKSKLLKTDEKPAVISEAKLIQISSTISNVTKNSLSGQSKLLTLNPISNQGNSVSQKTVDVLTNTPFDTLRKSPNFNVNMNALNEELAQTVQETTRALTDALTFQAPNVSSLQEVTAAPPKLESPKEKDIGALVTPPRRSTQSNAPTLVSPVPTVAGKTDIGSPFVETRKDLSNVFELSTNEGSTSISESKDNKFEFENAKKMLSATVCAFDLDPSKYENKPTSIADKLLKAISQKKEEDKHRVEPKSEKVEEGGVLKDSNTGIAKNASDGLPQVGNSSVEPLNINTDLVGSSVSYLSSGSSLSIEKMPLISVSINKPVSLSSPEPKLGILESFTVKNNDLTETIQKLECAIQRKTPVAGLSVTTTPTSSLAPNTFSEDSMDSTDSERRLVIEDVAEDICDMLKSPTGSQHIGDLKALQTGVVPHKIGIAISKEMPSNLTPHTGVQTPIPLKALQPSRSQPFSSSESTTTSTINITPTLSTLSVSQSSLHMAPTEKPDQKDQQFESQETHKEHKQKQQDTVSSSAENIPDVGSCYSECIGSRISFSSKQLESAEVSTMNTVTILMTSSKTSKHQNQRAADVVPIVVPDIPVSVVVASGAVPSIKAAAQAAATAQNPTSVCKLTLQPDLKVSTITATKPSSTSIVTGSSPAGLALEKNPEDKVIQNEGININVSTDLTLNTLGTVAFSQLPGISSNSGFYLDARTVLRPEDGVKPIADSQRTNPEMEFLSAKEGRGVLCTEELTSSLSVDANNDSINLLCEETIPGSPAPAFGGKEEPLTTQLSMESNLLLECDNKDLVSNQIPDDITRSVALIAHNNSSPNDSASQDESSEEIKKNLDIENEISPRKRRRTRKQSEMVTMSEQHTKRRKQIGCSKKIPVMLENIQFTAGSDSDENSDGISQRTTVSSRHQFHQLQQRQTSVGTRPCPYNFLVQLDPNIGSDQCIAILLKQIQELRKTYNTIKGDLANIDRRRKKLRRREREKKQQAQNQQQTKIT
ncbi:AT-rich interactive domain-containing protein 4A isoform X1 [Anastrepha obliqua]|uniref:AT-rich interactive domain-containing protein 4A isoform X1 n=1 Tax=Anastrepha obliqua TaxID=95512 RepID=UPI002409B9B7|nr:AT-rich interactive domain-containing protein 4A isoform X1 [Anastrepha obliqua]